MNNFVERMWRSYAEAVVPADAPPVQWQETRRAFYAGVKGLLTELMVGLDPDGEPTEGDLRKMSDIQDELHRFVLDVRRGKK